MKKRLMSLCLALPFAVAITGCDNSETPTAPSGKKVEQTKDIVPEKPAEGVKKNAPEAGKIYAPN